MDARIKTLLNPALLGTMDGLELIARIIVEGFMSGGNKSQAIGSGQEFSQYRNYEPGDDLMQLDWKMYARSERYYIKQAEIETNITIKFMIDASNSMAYEENDISKLQYARVMVAALAYLARKQGDAFGLFTVNESAVNVVQPRFEQQQFMRFLHMLVNTEASGSWRKEGLEHLYDHHGKEMVIFVTDMYDEAGDLLHFISRLKTKRNEVMVFHLLGKMESDLGYGGSFTFLDLETNAIIKTDTSAQQKEYADKMQHWMNSNRQALLEKNINYHIVSMDDNIEVVLRDFLRIRKGLRG